MKKMITRFIIIPPMIARIWNSDFKERIVVSVPAPARSGKTIGMIVPDSV
jgi:hypothetical protein